MLLSLLLFLWLATGQKLIGINCNNCECDNKSCTKECEAKVTKKGGGTVEFLTRFLRAHRNCGVESVFRLTVNLTAENYCVNFGAKKSGYFFTTPFALKSAAPFIPLSLYFVDVKNQRINFGFEPGEEFRCTVINTITGFTATTIPTPQCTEPSGTVTKKHIVENFGAAGFTVRFTDKQKPGSSTYLYHSEGSCVRNVSAISWEEDATVVARSGVNSALSTGFIMPVVLLFNFFI